MNPVYYHVAPRYTPGSPAMVPEAIARDVARAERSVYEDAVNDKFYPSHKKALEKGLAWIVWAQWEQANTVFRRCLLTEKVRQYKAGKPVFRIKAGPLAGALVQVVRKSARTGGFTLRLIEAWKAYKVGDEVHLAPYEVEEVRF